MHDISSITSVRSFWDDIGTQRNFIKELEKKLHITDKTGWYNISMEDIERHSGSGLSKKYHGSLPSLLQSIYPEYQHYFVYSWNIYQWELSKFSTGSWDWNDPSHHQSFMNDLAKRLHITHPEKWYDITNSILNQHGAGKLLQKYGNSLQKLFQSVYPEYLENVR